MYVNHAYFGRTQNGRFDAPDATYGVCYLGTTLACCLLEVFSPQIQRTDSGHFLSLSQLRGYMVVNAHVVRPLRLAKLSDDGLATIGIDLRVTGGDDYNLSQRWSAAIHSHADNVDGILYPSRRDQRYSVALFERAGHTLNFELWGRLGDPDCVDLLAETTSALRRFEVELLDDLD
jgi:hypothetical protein